MCISTFWKNSEDKLKQYKDTILCIMKGELSVCMCTHSACEWIFFPTLPTDGGAEQQGHRGPLLILTSLQGTGTETSTADEKRGERIR